ncbi:MAG TPA: sulfur carrier protein ThiS [Longimicrobiales bacterium]|jgi:thiamine biosynthesis protein ThiS|nr:sulfur carrier protein ThiS [Longimicrobiales bacterium]
MMTVTVNGENREIAPGTTVSELLTGLGLHPRLIVVEHNREILDRTSFDMTELNAGDNLELVHFVGGG